MFKSYLQRRGVRDGNKDRYSLLLSLASNSYNDSYYKQAVQCSQFLKEFGPELGVKLAECDKRYVRATRRGIVLGWVLLVIDFLLAFRYAAAAPYIENIGVLTIYFIVLVYFLWVVRLLNEERAALLLFFAIGGLEGKTDGDWLASRFRYGVARRVERVAKRVERIPLGFRGIAPSVRRDAMKASQARAQAFRQLEASIVIPSSLTRTGLIDRLKGDLRSIADDRWYELPEGQPVERARSHWIPIVQVTASVLAIGLAIFIATLAVKMGPTYSVLSGLLLSLGLVLLNRAGLSTGFLSDILRQDGK